MASGAALLVLGLLSVFSGEHFYRRESVLQRAAASAQSGVEDIGRNGAVQNTGPAVRRGDSVCQYLRDGIKCHICNSDQEDSCNDPFKAVGDPITCEDDKEQHEELVTGRPSKEGGEGAAKCLKVIYAVKGKKLTERGCTVNPQQKLTCDDVVTAVQGDTKAGTDIELTYCDVCDKDGCNRAAPGGPSLAAAGALPLAVALASLRGCL